MKYKRFRNHKTRLAGLAVMVLLSGCGRISDMVSGPIDYESAQTLPPLKVPPDLLVERGGDTPFPTVQTQVDSGVLAGREPAPAVVSPLASPPAATTTVNEPGAAKPEAVAPLPPAEYARLGRSADGVAALAVEDSYESVWRQLGQYLAALEIEIQSADPRQGLYQVQTMVEKKSLLKRITSFRRKEQPQAFQLRVVGAGSVSLVNLLDSTGAPDRSPKGEQILAALQNEFSAYGRRRFAAGPAVSPSQPAQIAATPAAQPKAVIAYAEPDRARLGRSSDGVPTLALEEALDSAWQRVGASLDRLGFAIDGRSREQGIYYVQYQDAANKKGFFKRMIPWGKNKAAAYQVRLIAAGSTSLVTVADESGTPDRSESGERILGLLRDELR